MATPLVTIICICYNHEKYVESALISALNQTYTNVELIVVDDASTDNSSSIISAFVKKYPEVKFIQNRINLGNCKSFNRAFKHSKGEFIIDLATDDKLAQNRVMKGLETFNQKRIGVEFCNVANIDSNDKLINNHFDHQPVSEGDVYEIFIRRYFVSAPGMMIKREVLKNLNGYDSSLGYEDFDFWIRSSRLYHYGYTNDVLVEKRILQNSLSKQQTAFRNLMERSTWLVCKKILRLNKSKSEDKALRIRIAYEIRQCLKHLNYEYVPKYLAIYFRSFRWFT